MSELAITLKKLRKKRNITQQKLVELSGLAQGTIGDIERGKIKKGSVETLEKISLALNLDKNKRLELFSVFLPEDIKKEILLGRKDTFHFKKNDMLQIPVYEKVKVSVESEYINLKQEIYCMPIKKGNFSEKSFLIKICEDNITSTFDKEELALIDPNDTEYVKNKVYLLSFNNQIFIKKMILNKKTGLIILRSNNEEDEDIIINKEEQKNLKIEGRVIQIIINKFL